MHKVTFDLDKNILEANKKIALANRKKLEKYKVKAYDVLGAIGSGKTALIERISEILAENGLKVGAIAGDMAGNDDYLRFKKKGIQAVNINTGKECHLDAHLVEHALEKLPLQAIDILFIENVGNLICPVDFQLGALKRIVVISVTEGDDMIRKHPAIFGLCDLTVLNKMDLAELMGVDLNKILTDFKKVNPNGKIVLTNAKDGEGIEKVIKFLEP